MRFFPLKPLAILYIFQMKFLYTSADFPAPATTPVPENFPKEHLDRPICIFLDLEGVMMNFTEQAAFALDQLDIPVSSSGLISPNPIYTFTTDEVFHDVCHGFDFYAESPTYQWSDILFEKCFQLSHGKVYFLAQNSGWDRESWGGKAHFVWRNYGQYGYDHLLMMSEGFVSFLDKPYTERDILIDDDMENIKKWCLRGGTGLWWPEIDYRADTELVSAILIERFRVLTQYVKRMQQVSA
jgi:hypothetical protein